MNNFQEKIRKIMPKLLLLLSPFYAGFAYLMTHMEILSFLGDEFLPKKDGHDFPIFDTGPNYMVFIGIFLFVLIFFIIDLQILSTIAFFGIVYTVFWILYRKFIIFYCSIFGTYKIFTRF